MTLGQFLVLLVVGGFVGSLVGRLVTFSRAGFGLWINLAIGMIGALVGKLLFWMLHIDLGLGELKVTGNDLVAAFAGSLLCIAVWWTVRWRKSRADAQG